MGYELINESFPRAKKAYMCVWCGEVIKIGKEHRHEVSKYEGNFQDHRWHLECDNAAKDQFADGDTEFELYSNERPSV